MMMNASKPPQNRSNRIRQIIRHGMTAALPRALFMTSGARRSGQVCLTFDDGPDPEQTPRLLDTLAELGIKATFFVIGEHAERFPKIVRRMADEGHALGNHTWSHRLAYELSLGAFADEVERPRQLLADLTGNSVDLFRPPHGKITARQMLSLWQSHQTVVLWNSDPKDYQCTHADELRERLLTPGPHGGDLVLMHDNRPFAADVMRDFAGSARNAGLSFATIPEWTRKTAKAGHSRPIAT
jgi:peptidoglycan-N-acetylglucosamine deacetylase